MARRKKQVHYWHGGLSVITVCARTITMRGLVGAVTVEQVTRDTAKVTCDTCSQILRWHVTIVAPGGRQ